MTLRIRFKYRAHKPHMQINYSRCSKLNGIVKTQYEVSLTRHLRKTQETNSRLTRLKQAWNLSKFNQDLT